MQTLIDGIPYLALLMGVGVIFFPIYHAYLSSR